MTELLIRDALVIDGSGTPGYPAHVTVAEGRVTGIHTSSATPSADRTVDAAGRVLSPGFIDMHAHSDLQLLVNPTTPPRSARA